MFHPKKKTMSKAVSVTVRCQCLPLLMAMGLGASLGNAWAAPSGAVIVSGQVTMSQQDSVLSITNSPNAIINWASFSISENETVRFLQQSADSNVLNRITGQDPSRILGTLQSNGRVYLINPNGILFGAQSQINVNGLVASTLNISDSDFLARRNQFTAGAQAGDISNEGTITTPSGGRVVLLASNVNNTGVISSPQGEVLLAAGQSVTLVDTSNPDVHVVVSAPENQVVNLGSVVAQSGKIGIYGALISQRGMLSANGAEVGAGGKIMLKASKTTMLEAGSRTTAIAFAGQGGEVQVLGEQVSLLGEAVVDVSGETGGGTALIGRNAAVQNAQQTHVSQDARVSADARVRGDGGTVIVAGTQTTQVYGSLSARGGELSGKGGQIETSGNVLDVNGIRVNAQAPNGRNGRWLLDALNLQVVGNAAANGGGGVAPNSSGFSTIAGDTISNANADVVLQARNNISVDSPIGMGPRMGLTLQAGNDIQVNAAVSTDAATLALYANDNSAGTASGVGKIKMGVNGSLNAINGGTVVKQEAPLPVPPSADICSIAPNSALCQVLSPPTASEPVKPVQQASNMVISTTAPPAGPAAPSASDAPKPDDTQASATPGKDEPGVKNEPIKKMYCN